MKTRERNELFDTLPGIRLPVAEVTSVLSRMWHPEAFTPGEPPTEYRASRMNLILHFGLKTSVREAEEKFDVAVRFALRHPCRLVVLCPQDEVQVQREQLLEGKLFSQCHLGGSVREISCLEALILGYPTQESGFLENQVSVWLESDLPTYHWLHRVPEMPIRKFYLSFMRTFRRVVYDSSLEGHDYSRLGWPEGDFLQDLAYARTLPLRQSAGQFLSRFAPPRLCRGLRRVTVRHGEDCRGEGEGLLAWQRDCLRGCFIRCGEPNGADSVRYVAEPRGSGPGVSLQIEWEYAQVGKFFRFEYKDQEGTATVQADLETGPVSFPVRLGFLTAERALAEALFP